MPENNEQRIQNADQTIISLRDNAEDAESVLTNYLNQAQERAARNAPQSGVDVQDIISAIDDYLRNNKPTIQMVKDENGLSRSVLLEGKPIRVAPISDSPISRVPAEAMPPDSNVLNIGPAPGGLAIGPSVPADQSLRDEFSKSTELPSQGSELAQQSPTPYLPTTPKLQAPTERLIDERAKSLPPETPSLRPTPAKVTRNGPLQSQAVVEPTAPKTVAPGAQKQPAPPQPASGQPQGSWVQTLVKMLPWVLGGGSLGGLAGYGFKPDWKSALAGMLIGSLLGGGLGYFTQGRNPTQPQIAAAPQPSRKSKLLGSSFTGKLEYENEQENSKKEIPACNQ